MKKSWFFFALIAVLILQGCSSKKQEISTAVEAKVQGPLYVMGGTNFNTGINFDSGDINTKLNELFTLDYTPASGQASLNQSLSFEEMGGNSNSSSGKGIVPGLRSLDKYKIDYTSKTATNTEFENTMAEMGIQKKDKYSEEAYKDTVFEIESYGPTGSINTSEENSQSGNTIFVNFSEPVIPLTAIGEPVNKSDFITVSPEVPGVFRWKGTRLITFEPEEKFLPQQIYTVKVNPELKALSGKPLEGMNEFTFNTESLSIKSMVLGPDLLPENGRRIYTHEMDNIPPQILKTIDLDFSYYVNAQDVEKWVKISWNKEGTAEPFTVKMVSDTKARLSLGNLPPVNTEVTVTLLKGAVSYNGKVGTTKDQKLSFTTLKPFEFRESREGETYGIISNPVTITMNQPVTLESILKNIRTEPAMEITEDNIRFFGGNSFTVYGLPVEFDWEYNIILEKDFQDIYGQTLGNTEIIQVKVPDGASFVDVTGSYFSILEAEFPPKVLIDYQNIPRDGTYYIASIENPFSRYLDVQDYDSGKNLPAGEKNTRYIEEVDFSPYLNESLKGLVAIDVEAPYTYKYYDWESDEVKISENTYNGTRNIQVTDLGVTVRTGINKSIVWVNKLSDGEPVEGANVYLVDYAMAKGALPSADITEKEFVFTKGSTDSNGIAILDTTAELVENMEDYHSYIVAVETKDESDKVFFEPNSHNPWRGGVDYRNLVYSIEKQPEVFLFTDRGLYKPGETLSYSGIWMDLQCGIYTPAGEQTLTIKLSEPSWDGDVIYEEKLITNKSGSFSGEIKIPDELDPDYYNLEVYVSSKSYSTASIPVKIGFFERLKFQVTSKLPETISNGPGCIKGDTISIPVTASYLAGGALGSAEYSTSWYKSPSYFSPQTQETKGYRFGINNYQGRKLITTDNGQLDGNGTVTLSLSTNDGDEDGGTYVYSMWTDVTDSSNQQIGTGNSVTVHPASFYIGLKGRRYNTISKGKEFKFEYILADTRGNRLKDKKQLGSKNTELYYEITRTDYTETLRTGVNGNVYTSYTRNNVTEATGKLKLDISGNIPFTPEKSGEYTLLVYAFDKNNRKTKTELSFFVTGSGYYMMPEKDIMLYPSQDIYNPGDKAEIIMQSPLPEGDYLITVEREGIFSTEIKHFDGSINTFEIPIARNYTPVVYVSVCSYSVRSGEPVHKYGETDLDKPKEYFGITAINVNPYIKSFNIKAESDKKVYRPGETVTMDLTATKDGKPIENAELILLAVDRGVLDLINYRVPDPIEFFYNPGKFPLFVSGGSSYTYITDPVTYDIKNLAGGDASQTGKLDDERTDFNPTAVFKPGIITGKDGKATVQFTLPDNLTTYRVTVIGVSGNEFARQEQELGVQNPVNVREVLPRRLRVRDTAEAGVLITNLDKDAHEISVEIAVSPFEEITGGKIIQGGEAFIDGVSRNRITVNSGETLPVYFDIGAVKEGQIKIEFTVLSDVLNEKITYPLIIEKPNVYETVTTIGQIDSSKKKGTATERIILPAADSREGNLEVTLESSKLSSLKEAADYTFHYPYGCLEQRSAAILPLVLFGDYIKELGLDSEVENPQKVIETEIKEWYKSQLSDGSFPYWPDGTSKNTFVTNRIAHIFALIKKKNICDIDEKVYGRLMDWVQSDYQNRSFESDSKNKLYEAYVLSLAGRYIPQSGEISEYGLKKETGMEETAMAGLIMLNMGNQKDAKTLAKKIERAIVPTAQGIETDALIESKNYFYSVSTTLANMMQLLVSLDPDDENVNRIFHTLLSERKTLNGYWSNTAGTFKVFEAVDTLITKAQLADTDFKGSLYINKNEILSHVFKGLSDTRISKSMEYQGEELKNIKENEPFNLTFEKDGKGSLLYTTKLRYAVPAENYKAKDMGISLFYEIRDLETDEIVESELVSGKMYKVTVNVDSPHSRDFLALRVPVPSGCEILDSSYATTSANAVSSVKSSGSGYWNYPDNKYIFDNEIQYFWDKFDYGQTSLTFTIRATRRGVYPVQPVTAECMYEPEIFGRTEGRLFTIK